MFGTLARISPSLLVLVAFLVIWELIVLAFEIPGYLLPPPTAIVRAMWENAGSFSYHLSVTLLEAVLGFIVANAVGFGVGLLFAQSMVAERAMMPYAILLKTTPIIALAPLLVLWFGIGLLSKVVTAALISFFPIVVSATNGLRSVPQEAVDLLASLSASPWQVFRFMRFPYSLPYLFAALKISSSLSVVGAVVGEFVGANKGLGYVILVSSYHLETSKMFAAIVLLGIAGIAFYWSISWLERVALFWREPLES